MNKQDIEQLEKAAIENMCKLAKEQKDLEPEFQECANKLFEDFLNGD